MTTVNTANIVGNLVNYFVPRNDIGISMPSIHSLNENTISQRPQMSNNTLLSNQVISQMIDQISNNAASQNVSPANFQFVNSRSNFIPNAELLRILYRYQTVMNITV